MNPSVVSPSTLNYKSRLALREEDAHAYKQ